MAQEGLVRASGIPYTILRSTQFFEFVSGITQAATDGSTVRVAPVLVQPVVSDDVAFALADLAVGVPLNDMAEIAGPEVIRLDELVRRLLSATHDEHHVITDVHAPYFGSQLGEYSLMPGPNARLGTVRFSDWVVRSIGANRHAPRFRSDASSREPGQRTS
jgi:uncharacterized protein YbjT (DUF2867 family)